jgi:hypothetical protein
MKIIEKTFDVATGEETITERNETPNEKKEREAFEKEIAAKKLEFESKTAQRQAIADRLGLTADELQILLG